ncbi:transcriptional regulator, TetR family [Streptoalloteichus tenebrarius]|uniref:Transcriptional regulator, TetR family n=1 Tax=Streptoalloteichus tenebrarius (strain ATCC 17920 / DSM 40477 / JCM 4838 / CBS 697.72 / NBRC 16177 / NCIMB 11028 / NRRL B-12390 / A12253. 1 / ISP 5477) TaxID=1933 RepID=A0ABT1HPY9_STRSD|nr:TetR/AcrR family transcriptional regulator [Streptoalloteichus tenebrarius]MCP2257581.1 transcriptional regulator, TetR family [Streptoalloteichus tenebrarius]BFE98536.1 TetR/AcrR family transcriptional regulator [Streptoalloteichus tenebrarius]
MVTARPLRRDAQRNRELLVAAARALFAERGIDVPLEEIARRAGVSIGTLYNRFPHRAALIDAVFADRVTATAALAEHALAMDDPWEGFVFFLERVCELQATDRGYNDLAARRIPEATATEEARRHGERLMRRIVARAQEAGALRADLTLEDLAFVFWGQARTVEATREIAPDAWRRHLALMLDGLRASAAHPLPEPPLRPEEAMQAMGGCRD